jgi:transcriptional regulator of acetoin/glycerol metabolism
MIRRLAPRADRARDRRDGHGEELVARALHQTGPRRDRRFVTVSCSAAVEGTFESELFGHVRGAFPAPPRTSPACSSSPMEARCFSTKSGAVADFAGQAASVLEIGEMHRVGSMDARRVTFTWSPQRIGTCAPTSPQAGSEAISSTG